jgi:hypothetical protein
VEHESSIDTKRQRRAGRSWDCHRIDKWTSAGASSHQTRARRRWSPPVRSESGRRTSRELAPTPLATRAPPSVDWSPAHGDRAAAHAQRPAPPSTAHVGRRLVRPSLFSHIPTTSRPADIAIRTGPPAVRSVRRFAIGGLAEERGPAALGWAPKDS